MRHLTVAEIMLLQGVKRWHTRHSHQVQTLASHSAAVALLALQVGGEELPADLRFPTVMLGLHHDAHEILGGDNPSPARVALLVLGIDLDAIVQKMFWGEDNALSVFPQLVHDLVAVADKLDAALWAQKHVPDLAASIAAEAEAVAMKLFSDEHRWGMRTRALGILREVL
jgi:5'-deoxynucleotidase YfbR-like HD superfamily hydrolase